MTSTADMTLLKKIAFTAAALAASLTSLTAQAQLRIPASHNAQHSELLASQKPIGNDLTVFNEALFNDIREREALDDNEIFTQFWGSEHVNPYGNALVPGTKDINVASYVAPVTGHITSNYGYRPRFRRVHKGIDLALKVGDTVRVAFDGKVRLCKYERKGYGYYVVVRHDNGMETVYGHLSKFLTKPNARVKAGDPIALGGNTGRSTGPHLHFETRYMGVPINPTAIIDFDNHVPHKDIFTFNKATHDQTQKYTPTKRATKKRASASRKSTASKNSATKRKSTATSKRKTTAKK